VNTHSTTVVESDGARLHVERRGSGPALLMIPGGGGDGARYSAVARHLATTHTVLTYDRRGNAGSRPPTGPPAGDLLMTQQSADARAVIEASGFIHACVFGNSGGAIIALDLAARFPELVDTLIAHEPPLIRVLPDPEPYITAYDQIEQILAREGWRPAALRFMALNGTTPPNPIARGAMRLALASHLGPARDLAFFIAHEMRSFIDYSPDLDTIAALSAPVYLAAGHASKDQYPYQAGRVIAQHTRRPFVEFPGGHTGFAKAPRAFAAKLRELLPR
jgi:pimeloyl-ACP methyl ester carboxylesterase